MTASRRLSVLQLHLRSTPAEPDVDSDAVRSGQLGRHACRAAAAAGPARPASGPPVLVGGMVMDLQAHPSGPMDVQRGGSVPGRVTQSAGGVARNVAEGLARLLLSDGGAPAALPLLVSAVGDDLAGAALLQHWRALGLSTQCVAQLPGAPTPSVSVVFDLGGEVAACVADMALLEGLPPVQLLGGAHVAAALAACPILMLDGNLPQATLEEACRQAAAAGVPIWFEPVSVPKSERAVALLPALAYISPNEKELAAMAAAARRRQQQAQAGKQRGQGSGGGGGGGGGRSCCGGCAGCCCTAGRPAAARQPAAGSAAAAAAGSATATGATAAAAGAEAQLRSQLPDLATLLLAGVRHVVLTLGADGAALCSLSPGRDAVLVLHLPPLPARVVNCSGAGDCLVAGCLYGLTRGATPAAALAHGVAAARAAVESGANVPPGLGAAAVRAGAAAAAARGTALRFALPCSCGAGVQAAPDC
ncbi:pseudouridine kinase isoform X1 [Micractinium conductrix]|uniref:Pseudouridine kinase isoform X1 n=1 Tax=Micractinium conductrix TaxID=554055 RepID=A0A2P6V0B9_9CHLO|nr:pseudouridine kinase isoform X1 [Micractinium conductrix]|eukprot:PSC67542.1 pseudouridine kinase isoform X1 [Micractinium conductrix]